MLSEDVIRFLEKTPPFQFLAPHEIEKLARTISLDFYPRGTIILKQNGPPSDALRVIKKGAVKVLMEGEDAEEIPMDYKGEGDNFGFLSMIGKDRQRTTVIAIEDTLCYIIGRERVHRLIESTPAFAEYFMDYLSQYVDRTCQEMQSRGPFHGSSDRLLFTTPVGSIAVPLITVPETTSIQDAAHVMSERRISSLVITNRNGSPAGIVTDRDLREKVVAKARPVTEPVRNISNLSLIRVDSRDTCFEALIKMIQYTIHHLLVVEEGALKGVVTNHDLMLLQGTSPVSFARDILNQDSVEGLIPLTRKIFNIVALLLKENTQILPLSTVITEISDRLLRKVVEIGEHRFGPPPLPYCIVLLGSEGRREKVFQTDQNHALLYSDPCTPGEEIDAAGYFSDLGGWLKDSLVSLGIPSSPDGFMASNPMWCQPFRVWRDLFGDWILQASPQKLSSVLPLFDARPLAGKFMLFQGIRDHITPLLLEEGQRFFRALATLATETPPPVGFVKHLVVERDGSEMERLDLLRRGIFPVVDLVRIFALSGGIRETSTLERIRALSDRTQDFHRLGPELASAFAFMLLMGVHHQFEQIRSGEPPDMLLSPQQMTSLEKKTFREAFRLVGRLQDLAKDEFLKGAPDG